MKVSAITINESHEGGMIDKIFTDEKKAREYYELNRQKYHGCMYLDIEEIETN